MRVRKEVNWLKKLLNMGLNSAKSYFRDHLINTIEEEDWDIFSLILNSNHKYRLKEISKDESETIFGNFNYSSFLNYGFSSKSHGSRTNDKTKVLRLRFELNVLYSMASLEISSAKNFLKKWLREISSKNISMDLEFLLGLSGYDFNKIFSEEELSVFLKSLNLKQISESSLIGLKILYRFSKYNKTIVKPYMKVGIEHWFLAGFELLIRGILDNWFLGIFSEVEQKQIVKKINIQNLRKAGPYKTLYILKRIKNLIPSIYKEEVQRNLLSEDIKIITSLIRGKYFNNFTNNELTELFEKFDFEKIELGLFKELVLLDIPLINRKFEEARGKSNKLENLKKEIIVKFEIGDYNTLNTLFFKSRWQEKYKDSRLNALISEDFEEIFKVVGESDDFKRNFEASLKKSGLPFSIPFKLIFSNIKNTKDTVREIFKEEASKVFTSGHPLNIIAFLSRPEYVQVFTQEELQKIFTFENEYLRSAINRALEKDSSAPVPLVVLKRLADKGDKKAEEYLIKQILYLVSTGTAPIKKFLNKDGFISYLKNLNTEMQLQLIFSPDMDYTKVWDYLENTKVENLVKENVRKDFKRIIEDIQDPKRSYIRDDNQVLLKEIILSFGMDALVGLVELYSRDDFTLQFIAVECILTIYKQYKTEINDNLKKKLHLLFKTKFKPYYVYESLGKTVGEEEYKEILTHFKTEYNELNN